MAIVGVVSMDSVVTSDFKEGGTIWDAVLTLQPTSMGFPI